MKLLLDTHVFLWLLTMPRRLGRHLHVVEDERTELLLSAASSWEIVLKYGLGKLPLPDLPERYVPSRMRAIGVQALAIEHPHALAVASLPKLHSDPFDSLLVAQSQVLDLPIVTADPSVAQYPIEALLV